MAHDIVMNNSNDTIQVHLISSRSMFIDTSAAAAALRTAGLTHPTARCLMNSSKNTCHIHMDLKHIDIVVLQRHCAKQA
jgi:hypothetical protein